MALAALLYMVAFDAFADRISLVAAYRTLKDAGVGAWAVRMTLVGFSALLLTTTMNSIRHAALATTVATVWLAILATMSLLLSPVGALSPFGDSDGMGPTLIWGPLLIAAVHFVLIALVRTLARIKQAEWADLISLGVGGALSLFAFGVCARMVAGGWLAMKVMQPLEKQAILLAVFAAVAVIVFAQNWSCAKDKPS